MKLILFLWEILLKYHDYKQLLYKSLHFINGTWGLMFYIVLFFTLIHNYILLRKFKESIICFNNKTVAQRSQILIILLIVFSLCISEKDIMVPAVQLSKLWKQDDINSVLCKNAKTKKFLLFPKFWRHECLCMCSNVWLGKITLHYFKDFLKVFVELLEQSLPSLYDTLKYFLSQCVIYVSKEDRKRRQNDDKSELSHFLT